MTISDLQTSIGKNIIALALLCETSEVQPNEVLGLLRKATGWAISSFAEFEKPLLNIQGVYNQCIEHLRKFEQADRQAFHQIIANRTHYQRVSAILPLLEKEMEALRETIAGKQRRIQMLPHTGKLIDQKREREKLLRENSHTTTKLNKLEKLHVDAERAAMNAGTRANLLRLQLSDEVDMEVFKSFEHTVLERETLKARFFLSNGWSTLVQDCKVQNAFDAILREAAPQQLAKLTRSTPIKWWQWICCCRPTSRTH
jgi:hypothetical protein